MKKTITVLVFVLFITGSAGAQGIRIFYKVCESTGQTFVDFQRDSIAVKTLTDDLIEFEADKADPTTYSAKKVVLFDLMEGGKDQFNTDRFYAAKVDADSFFLMQKGGIFNGFAYFHADKRRGNLSDKTVRCAYDRLVRFEAEVDAYIQKKKEIATQKQGDFDSQTKGVITEYVKNLRSQRNDPVLEKGIQAWWRGAPTAVVINPILKIYFIQPSYEITRNEFGVILRKTVDTVYVYKMKNDGKCYVSWRSFGYESLGGAVFADDVKDWIKQDQVGFGYYGRYLALPGDRKIVAGDRYEVDCTSFAP